MFQQDLDSIYNKILSTLDVTNSWLKYLSCKGCLDFLVAASNSTLKSLKQKQYSMFDGHTTSNCCHGISLFVSLAIKSLHKKSIEGIEKQMALACKKYQNKELDVEEFADALPKELMVLTSTYVLYYAGAIVPKDGRITVPEEIKKIYSDVSKKFCIKIIRQLQKDFSYAISNCYYKLLSSLPKGLLVSGVDARLWGNYVCEKNVRIDHRRRYYAPCLFSSQVVLGFLAAKKFIVAVICDIISDNNEHLGRYNILMQGDGNQLVCIPKENYELLNKSDSVFVIGGFCCSNEMTVDSFAAKMEPWLDDLTGLIVANDTFYPQFPEVGDDKNFDSSPIVPKEQELKDVIEKYSIVEGVSKENPFFFFQNHYYPASVEEVLEDPKQHDILPFSPSFTPE